MPGIIGSLQALEAQKYLLGTGDLLTGAMLVFDGLSMEFRKVKFSKASPSCRVCGEKADIKTLEKLLNIEYQKFISIICFLKTAELRISTNDANIVFDSDLINFILSNKEIILEGNVENIYEKIIKLNINDKKKRRQHNSIINEKKEQTNELIKNNICPKCGGNIIDKKGRYGYFKGCSNYPKCKFIVRNQK